MRNPNHLAGSVSRNPACSFDGREATTRALSLGVTSSALASTWVTSFDITRTSSPPERPNPGAVPRGTQPEQFRLPQPRGHAPGFSQCPDPGAMPRGFRNALG